jgi:hypothetical protein
VRGAVRSVRWYAGGAEAGGSLGDPEEGTTTLSARRTEAVGCFDPDRAAATHALGCPVLFRILAELRHQLGVTINAAWETDGEIAEHRIGGALLANHAKPVGDDTPPHRC